MSKTEDVYRRLREEIETSALAPGEKLSETAVAERLGASRTPVREALRRLAREGLVDFSPGEVARVSHVSLSGVRELFEFRMILEPAAAAMVAADGVSSPGLVVPFEGLAEEFEDVAGRVGSEPWEELRSRFYPLTERFDRCLVEAAHNAALVEAIVQQRGQSKRLRSIAHNDPGHLAASAAAHLEMSRSIARGRSAEAAEAVREHLTETLETIVQGLVRRSTLPLSDVRL
ncbi:GntR family transcriptional regulator [Nocardiopsis flavescens]